jgi:hypothetical protein
MNIEGNVGLFSINPQNCNLSITQFADKLINKHYFH